MAVPYAPATDGEIKELIARMQKAGHKEENGGPVWHVLCPHCEWALTVEVPSGYIDTAIVAEPQATCRCAEAHSGRPPELTTGCGFAAVVSVEIGTAGP